ncbi:S-methyl-5-thioribose kinase [Aureococcus anophagefferens]|nr:S-methyl-5-thioribose kinase [Aureococcus anophagefferens]
MALLADDGVAAYVHALALPRFEGATVDDLAATPIAGGNLNYAWRCASGAASVFVKQAPDYIKCLGEAYGLTSKRMGAEVAALRELGRISPRHAPAVLAYDADRQIVVMEDLAGFGHLRDELQRGACRGGVAADLGAFLARVHDATKGGAAATYADAFGDDNNGAMRGVTEAYVFAKPWDGGDETNRDLGGSPALAARVAALRRDPRSSAAASAAAFAARRECLCHGDLHAGSVMTDGADRCVAIDAEFAFYGPAAFASGCCWRLRVRVLRVRRGRAVARRRRGAPPGLQGLRRGALGRLRRGPRRRGPGVRGGRGLLVRGALPPRRRRRVVPDLADIADAGDRETAELLAVEIAAANLTMPPAGGALVLRLDSATARRAAPGADPNARSKRLSSVRQDVTPLWCALVGDADRASRTIVCMLLRAGAKVVDGPKFAAKELPDPTIFPKQSGVRGVNYKEEIKCPSAWDKVHAIKAAKGWKRFAARHRIVSGLLITRCVGDALPREVRALIGEFWAPLGGS